MNERDLKIVGMISKMTNEQIAEEIGIEPKSLGKILTRLYKKFNITENKRQTLVEIINLERG